MRLLLVLVLALAGKAAALGNDKPNILIIVADDLGWADVGYHGSKIPTPTIDRLCREGVELDQHYVAPMCTPTRAALLTGRCWSRFGNSAPSNEQVLPFGTETLASALRQAGYATGITGKWHLGSLPKWGPRQFGFDSSHGSLAGGVNPWNHLYKHGPYSKTWHRNDELIEEEGHVTDLIGEEAVRFIKAERDTPFFLYVPFTAPHTPFDEPKEWLDRCAHIDADRRQYAACVAHMDQAIGWMLTALMETGSADNTLILFFSDNGGTNGDDSHRYPDTVRKGTIAGLNHPLRGWKTQVYQGGIRTPALVHFPARLKPRKLRSALHVTDWMPTLCGLAGYEMEDDLDWDGIDIWPVLTGENPRPEPRVIYTLGVGGRTAALRAGDAKLIRFGEGKDARYELYDLMADPNEAKNLAEEDPGQLEILRKLLEEEQARDNDAVPNPERERRAPRIFRRDQAERLREAGKPLQELTPFERLERNGFNFVKARATLGDDGRLLLKFMAGKKVTAGEVVIGFADGAPGPTTLLGIVEESDPGAGTAEAILAPAPGNAIEAQLHAALMHVGGKLVRVTGRCRRVDGVLLFPADSVEAAIKARIRPEGLKVYTNGDDDHPPGLFLGTLRQGEGKRWIVEPPFVIEAGEAIEVAILRSQQ